MKIFKFLKKLIKFILYVATSLVILVFGFMYFNDMKGLNSSFEETLSVSVGIALVISVVRVVFLLTAGPILYLKKIANVSEEEIEKDKKRVQKYSYFFSFMIKRNSFAIPIAIYLWYVLLIYLSPFTLDQSYFDEFLLWCMSFFSLYAVLLKYNQKLRDRFIKKMQAESQNPFEWRFIFVLSVVSFFTKTSATSYFFVNLIINQKVSFAAIILMISFYGFSEYLGRFKTKYL